MKSSSGNKGPGLKLTLNQDNYTPIIRPYSDRNMTASSFNSKHNEMNGGILLAQMAMTERDIAYDNYAERS